MVHPEQAKSLVTIESLGDYHGSSLWIKRDDLLDPMVSGNKLYKLKYNLLDAQKAGKKTVLTFGGAYSNHLAATAAMCARHGLQSIGIVRGEASANLNPTLTHAQKNGMRLHYISRSDYRLKSNSEFLDQLRSQFENPFIIPEGGANAAGIKGAAEILGPHTETFTHIVCAVGTGTTVAGMLPSALDHQQIIGVPVHKHPQVIDELLETHNIQTSHPEALKVLADAHHGGYAKYNTELLSFMHDFHTKHGIELDPIYTGKALMACIKAMSDGRINKGAKVLFIHTGGLQGNEGFMQRTGIKLFGNL